MENGKARTILIQNKYFDSKLYECYLEIVIWRAFYFASLIPKIAPIETPATTQSIPFTVKPVIRPRKVLNTESKK